MNGKSNHSPEPERVPAWETAAMIASFALVWAYYLTFHAARRDKLPVDVGWNVALLAAVGLLVWIFVRRLKRILAALNNQNKRR